MEIHKKYGSPLDSQKYKGYRIEMMMLIGALAVLLLSFLLIQFRYVFANVPETELSQFGINTYSEYVRRGFGEMLMVTAIGYGVLGLSYIVWRARNNDDRQLKLAMYWLLTEIGVFVLSIFRRLYLYQSAHGLTRIRVYGTEFLLILVGLLIMLGLRLYLKNNRKWYLVELLITAVLIIAASLVNVDSLIANRFPPTVNNQVDSTYITKLSPDASDGWIKAYKQIENFMNSKPNMSYESLSMDEKRMAYYHQNTLINLKNNYRELDMVYEAGNGYSPWTGKIAKNKAWLMYNLGEKSAWDNIKHEFNLGQMDGWDKTLENVIAKFTGDDYSVVMDRSFNTPLAR
jgi:hypothetical protein